MKKLIPNSYYKSIYDINYDKLKKMGIKCLMFDLDNTLALIDEGVPPEKVLKLIKKLNKSFDTYILSNNTHERISKFCEPFAAEFVSFALKPLSRGFKKIAKKKKYQHDEMCVIGDQLMTDILGGNRFGCYTILVDPLSEKDLKWTTLNRFVENLCLKRLKKKQILERGKYYE